MAKDKEVKEVSKKAEPVALPRRIHLNEFTMLYAELSDVQKAGFKALCGHKEWMYKEEWQEQLDKYLGKKGKE